MNLLSAANQNDSANMKSMKQQAPRIFQGIELYETGEKIFFTLLVALAMLANPLQHALSDFMCGNTEAPSTTQEPESLAKHRHVMQKTSRIENRALDSRQDIVHTKPLYYDQPL
jgi:hypothetical protein